MKIGEEYYFYQNDHLGTPQKMTAGNGEVVWSAKYNSFGKATIEVETVENNLRFPGQYEDAETGLYYNWHRYYDAELGRYLRTDPIGISGGINPFAYVGGNPLKNNDPKGLAYETTVTAKVRDCIRKAKGDPEKICKCFEYLTSDISFLHRCTACLKAAMDIKGKKLDSVYSSVQKCKCIELDGKSERCCDCMEKMNNRSTVEKTWDWLRDEDCSCNDECP